MSSKVAKKIIEVMTKVSYLQKDGNVDFTSRNSNSRTNYGYLSEEKVTSAVTKARIEAGLILLPVKMEYQKDGNLMIVHATYAFIDADSGEKIEVEISGMGVDSQDKSMAKALTQAFKYIQRQSFGISTGDDPDHVSSPELDEKIQDEEKRNQEKEEKDRLKQEKQLLNLCKQNYKKLTGGSMDGFDEFTQRLISENRTLSQINDFFLQKIAERKVQAK